ncbi:hypothetical protein CVT26_003242 [Gymnopilus dilepis]|uniref:Uncharacterized protein n=1 Tax=Gymnopilus dilepis TaxID=231916 RepID=A0A409Y587_9AGAR|nr:hypothetical protein CVT26_003242 [Gymnopilus dilepis]
MSLTSSADHYRLPVNVKPTHYDLTIKTDLDKLHFKGLVKVDLDVQHDTSVITFNSADLELASAFIYSDVVKEEQALTYSGFDQAQQRTTYSLPQTLPAGSKAQLKLNFSGALSGSMMGYYKSSWQDEGKTKYYALTQFEPTAARRAFPCWDEPLLKATFAITMISRQDTVNLSNMPPLSEQSLTPDMNMPSELKELVSNIQDEEWKITKFETTPPMSTYLAAYANGDFQSLTTSVVMPLSGKTLPLRIYATKDIISQAQFALEVKKAVLPLYEKVFDVEYPLPKLDTLVAHDFDVDAMENWGLITGRTNAYLLDPERSSIQAKKIIAGTQSHEIAHMCCREIERIPRFGNITTMEWWNYLYLNEAWSDCLEFGRWVKSSYQVLVPRGSDGT